MAGILDLPAELIVHVVSFLGGPDVFNARLANRYIENSSLPYFGKRFFRKKGYMITTPSINVLKSIANHDELRKYVQHVWFNPDCYTFVRPQCAPEEEMNEDGEFVERVDLLSEDDKRKWDAFVECIEDHAKMFPRWKLNEELTDAFSKLPNLAAIGMRRSMDHSPWGWTRLKETIGEDPRVLGPRPSGPQFGLQGPTKLFVAIINAAATANVDLKRLYTDVVEIDNIVPEYLPQETLDKACRSLLYLEFNAVQAWLKRAPPLTNYRLLDGGEDGEENEFGEGLLRLIKAVPHLHELGLQIFPEIGRKTPMNSSERLKSYTFLAFEKLAKHAPLRNLTRLKLEKHILTANILQTFMEPSMSHLRSLKIRNIRLLSFGDAQPWYPIFTFLRDSCPKLEYLLLYNIMHDGGVISFVEEHQVVNDGEGVSFAPYEHVTLEAKGREDVERKLRKVADKHWYLHKPVISYDMDEGLWHTDTSDEEW